MKRLDFFCSSPSSTAICSSLDRKSMVRSSCRPLDRLITSCSSQSPIYPNPHRNFRKSFSSSSSSTRKSYYDYCNKKPSDPSRRKSSADGDAKPVLSDKVPYIDWIDESSALIVDSKPLKKLPLRSSSASAASSFSRDLSSQTVKLHSQISASKHSPLLNSSASARSRNQVVVLWVSIHCKGCEGKVRKHISKMEGVRSFSIDLATKKVTVEGNVTPSGVLASLSKVKNAQLWPFQPSSLAQPT